METRTEVRTDVKTENKIVTRKLKEKEIENIINSIEYPQYLCNETKTYIKNKIDTILINDLKKVRLNPNAFETFKSIIKRKYETSNVDPGETIGIICAQSMSQMFTQGVLNTFHVAGIGADAVNIGLPRFTELTSAKKDKDKNSNSTTYIYFNDKIPGCSQLRQKIKGRFTYVCFKDIVVSRDILYSESSSNSRNKAFDILFGNSYTSGCSWSIIFRLNRKVMFEHNLSLYYIAKVLESSYFDLCAKFDGFDSDTLEIFIKDQRFIEFEESENQDIVCEDFIFDEMLPALYKICLCGIKGIKKSYPYKITNPDKSEEWIAIARGNNLKEILKFTDVDSSRTLSDQLWEIYETFGITATRKYLKEELNRIISYDGTYISPAHIDTLVGFMTYSGTLYSASRYGIKRDQVGPLAKVSFEESLDNIIIAAQNTEKDNMKSTSSNVMMCQRGNFGTGFFNILYSTPE